MRYVWIALLALVMVAPVALAKGHTPVTICHKPGTPAEHTITIDDSALPAHLRHGDYVGACRVTDPPVDPYVDPPTGTEPPAVWGTPPPHSNLTPPPTDTE